MALSKAREALNVIGGLFVAFVAIAGVIIWLTGSGTEKRISAQEEHEKTLRDINEHVEAEVSKEKEAAATAEAASPHGLAVAAVESWMQAMSSEYDNWPRMSERPSWNAFSSCVSVKVEFHVRPGTTEQIHGYTVAGMVEDMYRSDQSLLARDARALSPYIAVLAYESR